MFPGCIIDSNGFEVIERRQGTAIRSLPIEQPLRCPQVALDSVRKYLANNYEHIRESPARITVRECENSNPTAIATFSYGIEKTIDLRKMSNNQIEEAIGGLEKYAEQLGKNIRL